MDSTEIINEMIDDALGFPENIPAEFIVYAQLVMNDGSEILVTGENMARTIKSQKANMSKYRVTLNVKLIYNRIDLYTQLVLSQVFD